MGVLVIRVPVFILFCIICTVFLYCFVYKWRTQEFCSVWRGGAQQIQLRTEDRENGDLGAVTPSQRFRRQL